MTGKMRLETQNLPPAQSKLKSSTTRPEPGPTQICSKDHIVKHMTLYDVRYSYR